VLGASSYPSKSANLDDHITIYSSIPDSILESVAHAGDVNGDGLDDVIIGDRVNRRAFVIYGSSTWNIGSVIILDDLNGEDGFQIVNDCPGFGASVSSAGKLNDDDYDDLIIGCEGHYYKAVVLLGMYFHFIDC
jgi:hypothetical protein